MERSTSVPTRPEWTQVMGNLLLRTPYGGQLTKADCPEQGSDEAKDMEGLDYRGLVGCLLYISKQTRPDILSIVTTLSRFLDSPGMAHWKAAKRVLRYLSGTKELALTYRKDKDGIELRGAGDADCAGDIDDRRSTTGYLFNVQNGSGAISWSSKKQGTVATSSSEAEYQALAAAVQEAVYLRSLLTVMGHPPRSATVISEDNHNQSCMKIAHNPVMQKRSKHIDTKFHFIREKVEDTTVELTYCSTGDMVADALTKGLARTKLEQHRRTLLGTSLDKDEVHPEGGC